jgi:hypothetical protein
LVTVRITVCSCSCAPGGREGDWIRRAAAATIRIGSFIEGMIHTEASISHKKRELFERLARL